MTIWNPEINRGGQPLYQAIVDVLAADIRNGSLRPGDRLPTHRDLADGLGVTVGTVTRAYALGQRRGLLRGEVGRGTFVAGASPAPFPQHDALAFPAVHTDLRLNMPLYQEDPDLGEALKRLARRSDVNSLLHYQPSAGSPRHRAAGADWIERHGLKVSAEDVVVCAGAQHAILVSLSILARPGDTILTASLTYPGCKAAAALLGLRLEPVGMDEQGLIPEELEAACRRRKSRILYIMPTIHNPTTATIPEDRRRAIAEIIKTHDLIVIEDDLPGLLDPDAPPPITRFCPQSGFFITGTSKTVAGGLRVAYLTAPSRFINRLAGGVGATVWMAAPLTAEIASLWIEDGTADRIVANKRREAEARMKMAAEILTPKQPPLAKVAYHFWLKLPPPWRGSQFTAEAAQAGIHLIPAETFAVGQTPAPAAVRISLSAAENHQQLKNALNTMAQILSRPPGPEPMFV